jgi:hypothetical protein
MNQEPAEPPSHFPHWVALGSLAFVLWLFFSNTVPALRERSELRAHANELATLKRDYNLAIEEARLGLGPNAHFDLQALLIAIDQLGYTPFELSLAYPDQPATPPADAGDGLEPSGPNATGATGTAAATPAGTDER